jgi:hypothetical protein
MKNYKNQGVDVIKNTHYKTFHPIAYNKGMGAKSWWDMWSMAIMKYAMARIRFSLNQLPMPIEIALLQQRLFFCKT